LGDGDADAQFLGFGMKFEVVASHGKRENERRGKQRERELGVLPEKVKSGGN
jgi:hypothetical protein